MLRPLLALTLLALAAPTHAADTCAPVERGAGPPVYVLLHGYSKSPHPRLRTLSQVDDDLVNMARFFRAMGPEQMHVHGEPTRWLIDRLGETRRPASWRAVLGSVAQIRDAIADRPAGAPRPQVHVYFAGHGVAGDRDRLDLFSTPEAGADAAGYDGKIDSHLIAEHILRPLAPHADVHVIVDACHSDHLLQTGAPYPRRKLEPRPPRAHAILHDFTTELPTVGALLATRETTLESADYGGLFSHMVRSLAIGMADVDRDGVITYGEMAGAFPQIISAYAQISQPEVIAPGLDAERPFIDWRSTPAARVCLPGSITGKRILVDYKALFATLHLAGEPTPVWLPPGRILGLTTWGAEGGYFRAVDGPADFRVRSPRLPPTATPGGAAPTAGPSTETTAGPPPASDAPDPTAPDAEPADYWEPLPALFFEPVKAAEADARPPVELKIPTTIGGALLLGASVVPPRGREGVSFAPHVDLAGRVGIGRHRLLLQGGYAWWTFVDADELPVLTPSAITGHRLGGRVGYGVLTTDGPTEVAIDFLGGLHRLWNEDDVGPRHLHVAEFTLRAVLNLPIDAWSRAGLRFDTEMGIGYTGGWMGPLLRVNAGLDLEALLD